MTDSTLIDIATQTMLVALKLSAPILVTSLVIGFTISLFQSMTQIQEFTLAFVPKEIGGVPIKIITLDDGGDPTTATTNTRRFVTESKADIIMGSSTTPSTATAP